MALYRQIAGIGYLADAMPGATIDTGLTILPEPGTTVQPVVTDPSVDPGTVLDNPVQPVADPPVTVLQTVADSQQQVDYLMVVSAAAAIFSAIKGKGTMLAVSLGVLYYRSGK